MDILNKMLLRIEQQNQDEENPIPMPALVDDEELLQLELEQLQPRVESEPVSAHEPIAPPPLPGHGLPPGLAFRHVPPLINLNGHTFSSSLMGGMFPGCVFDGGAAFTYHGGPERALMTLFGVKCIAHAGGTCTKSDCDHSLESPEAVRVQLMPMPDEELFNTFQRMMQHNRLFELFHKVFVEVFVERGLGDVFDCFLADLANNEGNS